MLRGRDLGRRLNLVEHMVLGGFGGVDLQAERLKPQGRQALLNHLESRHLLGYKEHLLTPDQGVGDDGGDGLRLASARGPVQHKAVAFDGLLNRVELRRISLNREEKAAGVDRLIGVELLGLPGEMPLHQAVDDLALAQVLLAIVDVVPHHKLAE